MGLEPTIATSTEWCISRYATVPKKSNKTQRLPEQDLNLCRHGLTAHRSNRTELSGNRTKQGVSTGNRTRTMGITNPRTNRYTMDTINGRMGGR